MCCRGGKRSAITAKTLRAIDNLGNASVVRGTLREPKGIAGVAGATGEVIE
jgi:rhodanese-related sulfurtransferase